MKKNVVIDMDGVIVDFMDGMFKSLNKLYGTSFGPEDLTCLGGLVQFLIDK